MKSLAIIETHPIQYRAPVYRVLHQKFQIPLTVIYGSDFSISGYFDTEFRTRFSWDTDLLSGYPHVFLSRVADGGGRDYGSVSAKGLGAMLRRLDPSAILLPGYSPKFYYHAWIQALCSRRPILFRGETAGTPQSSGTLRLQLRDRLLTALYRRASKLLYIGQNSKEHFVHFGSGLEKMIFSPYCIDTAPFKVDEHSRAALRGSARADLGLTDADSVFLFSGKLSDRKGPDLLLEAVRAFSEEERDRTVIVFLGNGELVPTLKAKAECFPRVNVRFPGFQNQRELSRYFHASDLLVLPSRRLETWGLVVNEALHHGLPCVVSDSVGCAPDLISSGSTGEVFQTGSVRALSVALRNALPLVGRPDIREACRRKVADYSIDKAAEGIASAYQATVDA